ncbi:MAG: vitamin K epoxide reductase family protein [Nanoarchaeota archaeon]|nr:vitamin K epoxide reductase family protein [Nanoarchaeota archaeon]
MVKERRTQQRIILSLQVILLIGMILSSLLIYEHFKTTASEFCQFGDALDCDVVNKSPYANLDGLSYMMVFDWYWNVPYINISNNNWFLDLITSNAFLGLLSLGLIFILTLKKIRTFLFIRPERKLVWVRGLLIFGMIYGWYLVYVQHSLIRSYCIFCLGLDAVLLASVILSFFAREL